MKRALVLCLLLAGCSTMQPGWNDSLGDAVPYCMALGSVSMRVDGHVVCSEMEPINR